MHSWVRKGRKILEAVILSFSDQQIVTGLSMLIATRFYLGCSISAYHYDIVCNLVLMSVITHLCSITYITPYLHRQALALGVARVLLIGLTFLFAAFMFAERDNHNFPTGKPSYAPTNSTQIPKLIAPAACFVSGNNNITNWIKQDIKILEGSNHVSGFTQYVILILCTVVNFSVAAIYSRVTPEKHPRTMRWLRRARVPLLIGAWVFTLAATVEFMNMRAWMHESIWPADAGEYEWTFGQFLPLLLMMLAGLAILEAFSGKCCTVSVDTSITFIFALDHFGDALINILSRFWNLLLSTIIGKSCCRCLEILKDALFNIIRPVWNFLLSLGSMIIGKICCQRFKEEPFIGSWSESQQYLPVKGAVSSWKELEDEPV